MWQFDPQLRTALLSRSSYQASLDMNWPQRGLVPPSLPPGSDSEHHCALQLEGLSPSAPFPPELAYSRGNDLVATYPTTPERISMQVYWRIVSSSAGCSAEGIEIVPSLQTDRLDATMRLTVSSRLNAGDLFVGSDSQAPRFQSLTPDSTSAASFTSNPQIFLFRRRDSATSYVELIYPSDDIASSWGWSGKPTGSASQATIEHRIEWPFLEKGVIRRCRLRSLTVPRVNDELCAWQAWQLFQASELPLTA